jgi:hypothetical protein
MNPHPELLIHSAGIPGLAPAPRRPGRWAAVEPQLLHWLGRLAPISLAQMDAVALLDRTDTKYLLTTDQLLAALAGLSQDYRVLDIHGVRLSAYETLYFDTPDFRLYRQHHDGRRRRYKVRSRHYVETDRSFFEVKLKAGDGRTHKRRIETPALATRWSPALVSALDTRELCLTTAPLTPALTNEFSRITLVGRHEPERVTLDLNLQFRAAGRTVALPGLVVAEVKQAGRPRQSAFVRRMRAAHLHPTSFSKYCIGAALLYPDLKHNHFKPALRQVSQLLKGNAHVA